MYWKSKKCIIRTTLILYVLHVLVCVNKYVCMFYTLFYKTKIFQIVFCSSMYCQIFCLLDSLFYFFFICWNQLYFCIIENHNSKFFRQAFYLLKQQNKLFCGKSCFFFFFVCLHSSVFIKKKTKETAKSKTKRSVVKGYILF